MSFRKVFAFGLCLLAATPAKVSAEKVPYDQAAVAGVIGELRQKIGLNYDCVKVQPGVETSAAFELDDWNEGQDEFYVLKVEEEQATGKRVQRIWKDQDSDGNPDRYFLIKYQPTTTDPSHQATPNSKTHKPGTEKPLEIIADINLNDMDPVTEGAVVSLKATFARAVRIDLKGCVAIAKESDD